MSGAQAPMAPSTIKPPMHLNYDQASSIIGYQKKQQRQVATSAQQTIDALSTTNLGFIQHRVGQNVQALGDANRNIAKLNDVAQAWRKWNTTAVPHDMTPAAYKKSILG